MSRILKWIAPSLLAILIAAIGVLYLGHLPRELTGNEIAVDRIDADWKHGEQEMKFSLVVRNLSDHRIGGWVTFEITLDLTRVSVFELKRGLPEKTELLKKMEEAFSEGTENE